MRNLSQISTNLVYYVVHYLCIMRNMSQIYTNLVHYLVHYSKYVSNFKDCKFLSERFNDYSNHTVKSTFLELHKTYLIACCPSVCTYVCDDFCPSKLIKPTQDTEPRTLII